MYFIELPVKNLGYFSRFTGITILTINIAQIAKTSILKNKQESETNSPLCRELIAASRIEIERRHAFRLRNHRWATLEK